MLSTDEFMSHLNKEHAIFVHIDSQLKDNRFTPLLFPVFPSLDVAYCSCSIYMYWSMN